MGVKVKASKEDVNWDRVQIEARVSSKCSEEMNKLFNTMSSH